MVKKTDKKTEMNQDEIYLFGYCPVCLNTIEECDCYEKFSTILIPDKINEKNKALIRAINWIKADADEGIEEAKEIVESLIKLLDKQ